MELMRFTDRFLVGLLILLILLVSDSDARVGGSPLYRLPRALGGCSALPRRTVLLSGPLASVRFHRPKLKFTEIHYTEK